MHQPHALTPDPGNYQDTRAECQDVDYCLDDLEEIPREKGGIRQLLHEMWRKIYQTNAPRRLFTKVEMRAA